MTQFRHNLEASSSTGWRLVRYAIAFVVPVLVCVLQGVFGEYVNRTPRVMFLAGVFVVAWMTGPGPGVVATGISGLLSEVLFLRSPNLKEAAISLAVFAVLSAPVLLLTSRLQRAERRAHSLSRIREEFLTAASHELRNPLAALSLQLGSIQREIAKARDPRGERIAKKLAKAMHALDRVGRLIDLLMDVTRINSGRFTLELTEVDLVEVVREVVARVSEQPGSTCEVAIEADQPVVGRWDRARLDQVLTNLISNACKYGHGKPVRVALERDEGTAKIIVHDQGPGIPSEQQSRLFGRFERLTDDQNIAGIGLGLWVTRQIVDAHGGRVRVESTVGKGSSFIVELPSIAQGPLSAAR